MDKIWAIAPRVDDDVVRQLLMNRKIAEGDRAAFLAPDWEAGTHSPWLFKKMRGAVDRITSALANGEKIVIHGDYDADGVCGSTLLFDTLGKLSGPAASDPVGCSVRRTHMRAQQGPPSASPLTVFLPDRERDGYGVAMHTIERLASEGTKLLITVDCGIANADQLDRAHELGMDVIICDHHQMGDRLPEFATILHPLAPGEDYPNKFLCGTGVAFKLASALIDDARVRGANFPVGYEKWLLDLVAVATVTDVMPLLGENRVLEHFGLTVLRKTRRPGLLAILASAGADLSSIDTETIGFRIGPRLNAAGRIASAELAFHTLAAETPSEALTAATTLEALNRERQDKFAASYAEAEKAAKMQESTVLVVWQNDWLPGIVGLIAGRLVNDYGLPSFAFAKVGDHYVGSGRSVAGLHLVEAMNACGDIFLRKGGHPQACGLTIGSEEHLRTFQERMSEYAAKFYGAPKPAAILAIDIELPLEHATWDVLASVNRCAPFGEGNRAPLFCTKNVEVLAAETMGSRATHARLSVKDGAGKTKKMIGFGFGNAAKALRMGDRLDVAYTLEVHEWNGRRELQYRIVDMKRLC